MLGAAAGVYDYDWKESERRFGLALARDPVPPSVRFLYGMFYLSRWAGISRRRPSTSGDFKKIRSASEAASN